MNPEMRAEKPYSTRPTEALPRMPTDNEKFVTFMNMVFELGPGVVVPRTETELLATVCVERLAQGQIGPIVIDMRCGCGNLSVVVAKHIEDAQVWACDLAPETVELAWRNVMRFELQRRVSIVQGDMFENIRNIGLEGKVDLVLCSLPSSSDSQAEADDGPRLDRERTGTFEDDSFQQRLIDEAPDFLKPKGWLAFEFGEGQERQAAAMLSRTRSYAPVQLILDPSGSPRVALAMKLAAIQ
jgi:release factor glutamine methyltransferase